MVLAALLFLLEGAFSGARKETIVVDQQTIDYLIQQREDLELRELGPEERRDTIDAFVEDEILYREAYRRGLDQGDSRMRRNLILKMRGLLAGDVEAPTEADLRAFFTDNRARFSSPATWSLEQVYFSDPEQAPPGLRDDLRAGLDPMTVGVSSLSMPNKLPRRSQREIAGLFGADVARAILDIEDNGWHGPFESPRGAHFIRVVGREPARDASFEFTCEGGLTAADRLDLSWARCGVMLTAKWLGGSEAKVLFRNEAGVITVPLSELRAESGSWLDAAKRYTVLGVEHILLGIDHLLFVLGLLLIVRGPWMLVKTITAFTVAHSITLGLATLGLVTTPPRPVDAAIALSIVFLAVEILHARQGRFGLTYRHPWVVAFGFGLLHGLGFAGALTGIGLAQSEIPVALLFFNVGVEIGQLMFVCAFLLLHWSFRQLEVRWSRPAQAMPVYLIGTAATYWLMQRIGTIVFPV
jgi:hypothetical protein